MDGYTIPPPRHSKVVVLAPGLHRGVIAALKFAQSHSDDVQVLYVEIDPEETPRVREEWERWGLGVPLVILESPYRSLVGPVLDYIRFMDELRPDDHIVVVIPEAVTPRWWQKLLHNQSGLLLKFYLLFVQSVVVVNVRYWMDGSRSPAGKSLVRSDTAGSASPR